jgi:serine/threonine protein kinase
MIVSVISTLSYLQQTGICHRDLKPANLFLLPTTFEIKIIDFGESKDYFKDDDAGGVGTMATIRGTP